MFSRHDYFRVQEMTGESLSVSAEGMLKEERHKER